MRSLKILEMAYTFKTKAPQFLFYAMDVTQLVYSKSAVLFILAVNVIFFCLNHITLNNL